MDGKTVVEHFKEKLTDFSIEKMRLNKELEKKLRFDEIAIFSG
jgi:hypothetical protein